MRECEIHGAGCGADVFTEDELHTAAVDRSPIFEGKVLRTAILIIQGRHHLSTAMLAAGMAVPKKTLYRYRRGVPCERMTTFNSVMVRLVIFDHERRRERGF